MIYLKVIVKPGAKREVFRQQKENVFLISVKEKAERNLANERVLELIAGHFKISVKKVRIINGHQHPHKLLRVDIDL